MKIIVTQNTTEGNFTVGEVYEINRVPRVGMFVYVTDDDGNEEVVYDYEFEIVE